MRSGGQLRGLAGSIVTDRGRVSDGCLSVRDKYMIVARSYRIVSYGITEIDERRTQIEEFE